MRPSRDPQGEDALLPDDELKQLLSQLTPAHKMFLAGLGRGLDPSAAAVRAGWSAREARRIAMIYLTSHPVLTPLVGHIRRLRELASLDGEDPAPRGPTSVH